MAGEEWPHAHSQGNGHDFSCRAESNTNSASAHEWYKDKERCIFCEHGAPRKRSRASASWDVQGEYYALCPYASRVPYEVWLMQPATQPFIRTSRGPVPNRRQLAALLGAGYCAGWRKWRPLITWLCTPHPIPGTKRAKLAGYWKTFARRLPLAHRNFCRSWKRPAKSYSIKEVYFNAEMPEQAAATFASVWTPIHEAGANRIRGGTRPHLPQFAPSTVFFLLFCFLLYLVQAPPSPLYGGKPGSLRIRWTKLTCSSFWATTISMPIEPPGPCNCLGKGRRPL